MGYIKFLKKIISLPIIITFKYIFSRILLNKKNIIVIPDIGAEYNNDSIINYSSDNSLKLLRYILDNNYLNKKKIILVNFVKSHFHEIKKYLSKKDNVVLIDNPYQENFFFIYIYKFIIYLFYFSSANFIINSNVLNRYRYKSKKQKIFSLNYYTPFKFDKPLLKKICEVEHVFSTSKISSRYVSKTSLIDIKNFHELGFPRQDSLFNTKLKKVEILKLIKGNNKFKKVIVYAPTHRDYERNLNSKRNLFGKNFSDLKLNHLLKKANTLLVAKLHCTQNIKLINKNNLSNIVIHQPNSYFSLYDLLGISDALITDYSSVYFDYLQLNKPVFFYFYDFKKYEKTRGFMYEDILKYCAGDVSYNINKLYKDIQNFLIFDKDEHSKKREKVNKIFNKFKNNNTERVFQFIQRKII